MKLIKTFLVMVSCFCFISIAGCSRSNSSEQPTSTPSGQSVNNQAAQPAATPTTGGGSSAQAGEKATEGDEVADELHTPPMGSPERQSLMDALREEYKRQPYRGKITFVVNYLKVHNGWAWTYPEPRSSDPHDQFGENSGFLLHQVNGRWQVMKVPAMVDDPDDPENLDYPSRKDVERMRKMYPSVPTDVLPRQQ